MSTVELRRTDPGRRAGVPLRESFGVAGKPRKWGNSESTLGI
jgi:hypothetical protein